jgi:predicted nuclease of predicted toxin-antitoxin system
VKLHFDENVDEDAALGLRARGIDVTITSEENLRGEPDEEQIAFAVREGRVLVSHDRDMLRLAARGVPHLGIAYCRMKK